MYSQRLCRPDTTLMIHKAKAAAAIPGTPTKAKSGGIMSSRFAEDGDEDVAEGELDCSSAALASVGVHPPLRSMSDS